MRRSREQVSGKILEVCKNPTGKTTIVYQCNLNFTILEIHLQRLIDASLLESSGPADRLSYRTTPKGIEALEHINVIMALIAPVADTKEQACCPSSS